MRFELNADNHVWFGILLVIEALSNENAYKFEKILLSDEVTQKYIFEVDAGTHKLTVMIDEFSMQYKLDVEGEYSIYNVNIIHGNYLLGDKELYKYERLIKKFLALIKEKRPSVITKLTLFS
ncbi:MAG: hypothetical protein WAQ28_03675 [Bacteroidia bacterium]